jgi:hypothetical protein
VPATGLCHTLIDQVAAEFGQGPWQGEIAGAREEYGRLCGKTFEDDGELYEQRTTSFLEWYVAERPLSQAGLPPALVTLTRRQPAASVEEEQASRAALAAIVSSHRSVFEATAVADNAVDLVDLVGGGRFVVRERRSTAGFHKGDLFEARLFWTGEGLAFGKTFLFHPSDASEEILGMVKAGLREGIGRAEIVGRLSRVYIRWHRQREVGASRLYKEAIARPPQA